MCSCAHNTSDLYKSSKKTFFGLLWFFGEALLDVVKHIVSGKMTDRRLLLISLKNNDVTIFTLCSNLMKKVLTYSSGISLTCSLLAAQATKTGMKLGGFSGEFTQ